MTHDEIMAMAREAGFRTGQINLSNRPPVPFIAPASGTNCMVEIERFAALVAEAEREACAALALGLLLLGAPLARGGRGGLALGAGHGAVGAGWRASSMSRI